MITDAEKIAALLTEAQKDALFGRFSWASPMEQEDGERELYLLGIWGPHGGHSPLADAVRSLVEKERGE